eukprot:350839-Chlamydomonas_euryale.AAC.1
MYWADMCVVCGTPKPQEDGLDGGGGGGGYNHGGGGHSHSHGGGGGGAGAGHHDTQRRAPSRHVHEAAASAGGPGGGAGLAGSGLTRISHVHSKTHLEMSGGEADRLRRAEERRLLAARKLVLVLDLVSMPCPLA